jgi:glycosyltransferase involved in cell wall biosynthesis
MCAGYSNRDWKTLAEAWDVLPSVPLLLLGAPREAQSILPMATSLRKVDFATYIRLMARSRLVVLPLPDGWGSWGQMTMLQACALGKPVVVSDVKPVRDYLGPWLNAVPSKDPAALARAVSVLWGTSSRRRELGALSETVTVERFSEAVMARAIEAELLRAVTNAAASQPLGR